MAVINWKIAYCDKAGTTLLTRYRLGQVALLLPDTQTWRSNSNDVVLNHTYHHVNRGKNLGCAFNHVYARAVAEHNRNHITSPLVFSLMHTHAVVQSFPCYICSYCLSGLPSFLSVLPSLFVVTQLFVLLLGWLVFISCPDVIAQSMRVVRFRQLLQTLSNLDLYFSSEVWCNAITLPQQHQHRGHSHAVLHYAAGILVECYTQKNCRLLAAVCHVVFFSQNFLNSKKNVVSGWLRCDSSLSPLQKTKSHGHALTFFTTMLVLLQYVN